MKLKYFIYMVSCLSLVSGCSEFEDDRLKFEDTSPLYVKFTSVTKKTMVEGATLSVQVETPQFVYKNPITVNYAITGDFAQTGTVVIPVGKRTATFTIVAPDNADIDALKNSTVTITEVDNGLTVGRTGLSTSFQLEIKDDLKIASFAQDSTKGFESTAEIASAKVTLTNKATSLTTINYSISGGTAGVHYVDNGGGTATIDEDEMSVSLPIVILDNLALNSPTHLKIKIEGITGDDETSIDEEANTLVYTIEDDLKTVGLTNGNISLEDLTEADAIGEHAFEVTMDGESSEIVTVNYSVTGSGVTNLTGGSIKFIPGGSRKAEIVVRLNAVAFNADQTVTIQLTSIVSPDNEVIFDNAKTITLKLKAD